MTKRRKEAAGSTPTARAWLQSYKHVSKWMGKYDLLALLKQHGGMCRIENFLPDHVADYALQQMQRVPEPAWNATAAEENYRENNIEHMFWSTKDAEPVQDLLRIFSILLPDQLHSFSAARYDTSHHIVAHDDRAYTNVMMEDGQVVECSRTVAVIYYLTKDWKEEWGGQLLDLEGNKAYTPLFNSAVIFQVPRYHQVTPVTGPHPRYSVFGWFLQPGHLYELYTGEDEREGEKKVATTTMAGSKRAGQAGEEETTGQQHSRHSKQQQRKAEGGGDSSGRGAGEARGVLDERGGGQDSDRQVVAFSRRASKRQREGEAVRVGGQQEDEGDVENGQDDEDARQLSSAIAQLRGEIRQMGHGRRRFVVPVSRRGVLKMVS